MEKKVCPTKLSQFRRSSTSGQVSSKVGDLSPTDLSQQLASRRKNFPDKSGLLSTLTPATALPFPSTHSFILHWVVFFSPVQGRLQDTTAALYLKNISYHRWFLYSVTLSNLPWSARMIHIKIWSLRILKNTFCPFWELDGNQIMTSGCLLDIFFLTQHNLGTFVWVATGHRSSSSNSCDARLSRTPPLLSRGSHLAKTQLSRW